MFGHVYIMQHRVERAGSADASQASATNFTSKWGVTRTPSATRNRFDIEALRSPIGSSQKVEDELQGQLGSSHAATAKLADCSSERGSNIELNSLGHSD